MRCLLGIPWFHHKLGHLIFAVLYLFPKIVGLWLNFDWIVISFWKLSLDWQSHICDEFGLDWQSKKSEWAIACKDQTRAFPPPTLLRITFRKLHPDPYHCFRTKSCWCFLFIYIIDLNNSLKSISRARLKRVEVSYFFNIRFRLLLYLWFLSTISIATWYAESLHQRT